MTIWLIAQFFSKIDLRRAYQQVDIDEASQHKAAITTTVGLFKFRRMAYGLKNAGQCFQRNIYILVRDLPFLFVCMDNIIVGSKNHKEHERHLQQLFEGLQQTGQVINVGKCVFGQPNITFLGHYVYKNGISIPPDRADAIIRYSRPTNAAVLERFLGIWALWHIFIVLSITPL